MNQRQFKGLFKKNEKRVGDSEIKNFETKNMATFCHKHRKLFIQK